MRHSHSSIKLYEQCPRKFWHLRVIKDVVEPEGEQAKYGTWVHAAFEEHVKNGVPLPETLKVWESPLSKFLRLEVECEKELVLDEHLKPVRGDNAWWSEAAWLRAKIDLSAKLSPTSLLILDYKTGKHKPDFDQLELGALFEFAYDPELQVVIGAFVWTKHPELGLQDQRTYTRDMVNGLWAKHLARIKEIHISEETGNWPARPSGLCKWKTGQCAAYDRCPYGRR